MFSWKAGKIINKKNEAVFTKAASFFFAYQPFTEPTVIPATNDFWKKGYATRTGIMAMTASAIRILILGRSAVTIPDPVLCVCRKATFEITEFR